MLKVAQIAQAKLQSELSHERVELLQQISDTCSAALNILDRNRTEMDEEIDFFNSSSPKKRKRCSVPILQRSI